MPRGIGLFAFYRQLWQRFPTSTEVSKSHSPAVARYAPSAPASPRRPNSGRYSRLSLCLARPGLTVVASAQSVGIAVVAFGEIIFPPWPAAIAWRGGCPRPRGSSGTDPGSASACGRRWMAVADARDGREGGRSGPLRAVGISRPSAKRRLPGPSRQSDGRREPAPGIVSSRRPGRRRGCLRRGAARRRIGTWDIGRRTVRWPRTGGLQKGPFFTPLGPGRIRPRIRRANDRPTPREDVGDYISLRAEMIDLSRQEKEILSLRASHKTSQCKGKRATNLTSIRSSRTTIRKSGVRSTGDGFSSGGLAGMSKLMLPAALWASV